MSANSISTAFNSISGFFRPSDLDKPAQPDRIDAGKSGKGNGETQTFAFELDVPASLLDQIEDEVSQLEARGELDLSPQGVLNLAHLVKNQLRDSGLSIANARPDSIQGLYRL